MSLDERRFKRVCGLLQKAAGEAARGRLSRARAPLDAALQADPECAYAYFYRAAVHLLQGAPARAADDFEALDGLDVEAYVRYREFELPSPLKYPLSARVDAFLRARPRTPWARVMECFAFRASFRYGEALAAMEKAVRMRPRSPGLLAILARVRFIHRFPARGLRDLDLAVRLAPGCGWVRAWRAEAHRLLGRLDAALADADRAIELDPRYFRSYAWRGGVYRLLGRHREALRDFDAALSLDWAYFWGFKKGGREADPNLPWILNERFQTRRALGDVLGAIEDLNRAHRLNNRYGWVFTRDADPAPFDAARRELSRWIEAHPRDGWASAWRGWIGLRRGDLAAAERDLRAALRRGADHAMTRSWLGRVLNETGREDAALREFTTALRRDPRYAPALFWKGGLLRARGRGAAALRLFDRGVAADPICAWGRAWRGELRLALGDRAGAFDDLDAALRLDPENVDTRGWRARARLEGGDLDGALADLDAAQAARPEAWALWSLRALVLGKRLDVRGQRRALRKALDLAPAPVRERLEAAG